MENLKIRNYTIKASTGREVWNVWGDNALRYRFKITVKNEKTGAITYFNFYGSIKDYEEGKNELNKEDLKVAFWCFLQDAEDGKMDFDEFLASFGYEEKEGRKIWKACQNQLEKCERLGLNEDLRTDLLNNELANV